MAEEMLDRMKKRNGEFYQQALQSENCSYSGHIASGSGSIGDPVLAYKAGEAKGRNQGALEMDMRLTRENLELVLKRMQCMCVSSREMSLAITHLEDCLIRFGRAINEEVSGKCL